MLARDPFGVRPLYIAEHDGRLLLCQRGQGALRRRSDRCRAVSIRPASISCSRSGRRWRRGRCSRASRSSSRERRGPTPAAESSRTSRCWSPSYPADGARASPARSTKRSSACAIASSTPPACACCAPTCRSAATSRAASTARSSRRSAYARRDRSSPPSRCGSTTPSTTRPSISARWRRTWAATTTRCWSRATTSRACFPRSSSTPSGRSCARRQRRCSCCRGWCAMPGIKVVLTGEGADEMFAGYDLFREAKVRRFWAAAAAVGATAAAARAALPVSRALARVAAGDGPAVLRAGPRSRARPGLRARRALARDNGPEASVRPGPARPDRRPRRHRRLRRRPAGRFRDWTPLAQDQYLEVHTLLSGYLLSSQGDRMLMAQFGRGPLPVPRSARGSARRVAAAAATSCACSTRSTC